MITFHLPPQASHSATPIPAFSHDEILQKKKKKACRSICFPIFPPTLRFYPCTSTRSLRSFSRTPNVSVPTERLDWKDRHLNSRCLIFRLGLKMSSTLCYKMLRVMILNYMHVHCQQCDEQLIWPAVELEKR